MGSSNVRLLSLMCIISPFVFVALWIVSAVLDGTWTFGGKTLSNLGISEDPLSASLFNLACVAVGGAISVSGYIRHLINKDNKIVPVAFAAEGIFLLLIGVFTLSIRPAHMFVSITFGVISGLLILFYLIVCFRQKRYVPAILSTVLLAIAAIVLFAVPFALSEALMVIVCMIWFEIMGFEIMVVSKNGGDPGTLQPI